MKNLRIGKAITWISFVLAGTIYACMLLITLPTISKYAGGILAFDMRPSGYSFAEAQALLTALSVEGRQYYLWHQLILDIFYPAFLATSLFGILQALATKTNGMWKNTLIIAAYLCVFVALLDYAENIFIARMLVSTELGMGLVQTASWLTMAKSLVTTVVLMLLLIGVLHRTAVTLLRRVISAKIMP